MLWRFHPFYAEEMGTFKLICHLTAAYKCPFLWPQSSNSRSFGLIFSLEAPPKLFGKEAVPQIGKTCRHLSGPIFSHALCSESWCSSSTYFYAKFSQPRFSLSCSCNRAESCSLRAHIGAKIAQNGNAFLRFEDFSRFFRIIFVTVQKSDSTSNCAR